ncbi:Vegetative incompatibility protein HET-E-1 [Colletotrichum gloeosporioides]|uniref:Vegetative incompatibility protein HET-E-1 n=1 Tax=Colletotrichum gloeosporioides TaxID=474922 RepID=A0A8H4C9N2_COLGL|nr:Vegetative incompatibility protein HET-E-1 [Colletotrichum gloeosporioides]KAF3799944.1 Vegetative incompatibility protein HET-E-1 [Colletotrichum gloeosporioides]
MSSQYAGRKRRVSSLEFSTEENSTARIKTEHTNSGAGKQYNNSHSVNQEKDRFLADLRVTDPRDDKTRIQRTKGDLLVDSYRWILQNDEFCQWLAERRLLWIKGDPGKGKTMLLCGIIDELLKEGYDSTVFFFCQAADARINTANSVLRGLLYLILDQRPALCEHIRGKYDKAGAGRQLFEDANSWEVLCAMIKSAVSHETLHDIILVIDALDECISGLDQLIRLITDLAGNVKIIVSSRPEPRIDRALTVALRDTKIYLSLELNEDVISAAVNSYIHHQVDKLAVLKGFDDNLKIKVRDYLFTKADSTFLWVALVYEQLADSRVRPRHIERKLDEFPPGLDSLYQRILDLILGSLDSEDCRQVLAIMATVSRPIDLTELALLLDHMEFLGEIVEECSSLLTVKGGIIYFIHQSAKDFLIGRTDRIMPAGLGLSHNQILSKLLQSMFKTFKRNIYGIKEPRLSLDEICVPSPNPLLPVRYACVYWADHLTYKDAGQQQFAEVYSFVTKHFLH